jgi:hypothetical protein
MSILNWLWNDMLHIPDTIGLIGVGITLLAYILLNMRKLNPRNWCYSGLNALGSVLIMYSLYYEWNLAAWIMECTWLIVSIYGVYQALRVK